MNVRDVSITADDTHEVVTQAAVARPARPAAYPPPADRVGTNTRLTLTFPTSEYEMEFGATKRYLPPTVIVPADLTRPFTAASLGDAYEDLRRRHVILDAPRDY